MKWRCGVLVALAVVLLALPTAALAQQKVLRYAHFQPARPDQPKHAAALAFKEHVEKATNGSSSETTPTPCRGSGSARWTWPWPTTAPSP